MSKRNDLISTHYVKNYDRFVKQAVRRVPNNSKALAEEVVQEAYARALKYFRTFNKKTNTFDIWFNSILRNTINDCRTIEKDHGATVELHDNIEELVPPRNKTDVALLLKAINEMEREKDIHVLSLFFITGYRSRDIAEYLGTNHNTIRQIILRFKNKVNMNE